MERKTRKRRGAAKRPALPIVMSEIELAQLGDGQVAYIRRMSSEEAAKRFPAIEGLPANTTLYALHSADGTPIALTDTRQAALSHAFGDDLEIASVH
jgi:hypothetical protein